MSVKRKSYSADFKAKLVLEVLEGEKTVNEIASSYEVQPISLRNWKKQFLENMSLAFDKSTVVKEYKDEIETLKLEKDSIVKKLGEPILEKDFFVEKSPRLNLINNDTNSNNSSKFYSILEELFTVPDLD